MLLETHLTNHLDSWVWEIVTYGEFEANSTRRYVDGVLIPSCGIATRWCRLVSLKLNFLIWRVLLERITSRANLIDRSIDVSSLLCTSCLSLVEACNHVFVSCQVVDKLWRTTSKWLDLSFPLFLHVLDVLT